jgi:Domain of unknown function (DUF5680)
MKTNKEYPLTPTRGREKKGNCLMLLDFIITAKKATYIASGTPAAPSRAGSHDLTFEDPPYSYRDSYFGGADFIGQEVVWHAAEPVWAMNYYGYILKPDLITPAKIGETIKQALSQPKAQGRLLDNLDWWGPHGHYVISSQGTVEHFSGVETITAYGELAYQLDYHGGLIKP